MSTRWNRVSWLLLLLQFAVTLNAQQGTDQQPAAASVVPISVQDAIQRARKLSPDVATANAQAATAGAQLSQQRAALLPNVDYNAQITYNQPNPGGDFRFIASNAVREYLSLGDVHQELSLVNWAEFRRARAAQAAAKARAEIARRGLTTTVVHAYFAYAAAVQKLANAATALAESQAFVDLSSKLEAGGEVAKADVIKATIQMQDRQRSQLEAELAMNQARLDLAVLVFSSPDQPFELTDKLETLAAPPAVTAPSSLSIQHNPLVTAASADLAQAKGQREAAWAGFFPAFSLDYFYGIDATHFAVSENGRRNLGYELQATVKLPIWNWGANISQVRAGSFQVDAAKKQLSFAQARLKADIEAATRSAIAEQASAQSLIESVKLAQESLRLAQLRYRAGETTFLEVIDAQGTLNTQRDALVDAQLRYRVAQATLEQLTGVPQP